MRKIQFYTISMLVTLFMFACGGGSQKQAAESEKVESASAQAAVEETIPETISITIEGNDQMKFNKEELKVYEGQEVTLTLKHVGQMPKSAMGHNWVLLKPGTDIQAFGMAAQNAAESEYIPQDKVDQVIANTITLGGGEETTITFEAPKAGYYKYICSFPGHYMSMQGSFVVQPR